MKNGTDVLWSVLFFVTKVKPKFCVLPEIIDLVVLRASMELINCFHLPDFICQKKGGDEDIHQWYKPQRSEFMLAYLICVMETNQRIK